MAFSIQCPSCQAKLTVKDQRLIGRALPCPKCRQKIVVSAPAPAEEDDDDELKLEPLEEPAAADSQRPPRQVTPVGAPPPKKPAASQAPRKTATASGNGRIIAIAGGGATALLVVVLGIWLLLGSGNAEPRAANASNEATAGAAAPAPVGTQQAAPVFSQVLMKELTHAVIEAMVQMGETQGHMEHELDSLPEGLDRYRQRWPHFLQLPADMEQMLSEGKDIPNVKERIEVAEITLRGVYRIPDLEAWLLAGYKAGKMNAPRKELLAQLLGIVVREGIARKNVNPADLEQLQRLEPVQPNAPVAAVPDLSAVLAEAKSLAATQAANAPEPTVPRRLAENLKKVILAVLNFHDIYRHYPYPDRAAENKPAGLSWRVHILPHLEQEELYKQFHLDEPWDSPHNLSLLPKMPGIFKQPGLADGFTALHMLTGEPTLYDGRRKPDKRSIQHGLTVVLVLCGPETATEWTRPGGLELTSYDSATKLGSAPLPDGFPVAFIDGAVRLMPKEISTEMFQEAIRLEKKGKIRRESFGSVR